MAQCSAESIFQRPTPSTKFTLPDGQVTTVYSSQVTSAPFVQQVVDSLQDALQHNLWVGLGVYIMAIIFAAAAYRMRKESNPSILPLLRYLLTAEIGELQSLLQGTEAESLMSEKTEKLPFPLSQCWLRI